MEGIYQTVVDSWKIVVPELGLLAVAALMFIGSLFTQRRDFWASMSLVAFAVAGALWLWQMPGRVSYDRVVSASLFSWEAWRWLVRGLVLGTGALLTGAVWKHVAVVHCGEFFGCILSMIAGAGLVSAAYDLVSLFLGLETVSISTYIALYILRRDPAGLEAAVKYFLLSIFSSAIFLFGVSLLYLVGGHTNYFLLKLQLHDSGANATVLLGGLFMLGGLGFRVAMVPFHFYAPDVFAGTHPAGAAILSVVPKITGLIAMYQVMIEILSDVRGVLGGSLDVVSLLSLTLAIVAGATMFLGNIGGLLQEELYRLLAYSGIAHAGYMLVGLAAGVDGKPVAGDQALAFYLGTYVIMTVGAFAGLLCVRQDGKLLGYIDELSGLARSRPVVALCLAVSLLSLTGLPPAVGFWGKVAVILAGWYAPVGRTTLGYLTIFLVINAAIGAWYYLRILGVMYLRQPVRPFDEVRDWPAWCACLICTLVTVLLFFVPSFWWQPIQWAFTAKLGD